MTAKIGTSTTSGILKEPIEWPRSHDIDFLQADIEQVNENTYDAVRIESYIPRLAAPSNWLPILEERIRSSILPSEHEDGHSTEWLNENAASAAIYFFQNGVDLLPEEPHIYSTKTGDLVAEFETGNGSMTSVVSDKQTILFGVSAGNPHEPVQCVIRRGSNQFRDELRSFTRRLASGSRG